MSDGESRGRQNGGGVGELAVPATPIGNEYPALSGHHFATSGNIAPEVVIAGQDATGDAGPDVRFVRGRTDPDSLVLDILSRAASGATEMEWSGVEPEGITTQLQGILERAARVFGMRLEVLGNQWCL